MKKKRTLVVVLLLTVLAIGAFAFSPPTTSPPPDKERSFNVSIPAHLIGAFYNTFNGNLQNVSVQDYKEVTQVITLQITEQAAKYQYDDSLLSVKMRAKSSVDTNRAGPPPIKN